MRIWSRPIGVAILCVVLVVGLVVIISAHYSSRSLITAGPSRKSCIYPYTSGGKLQPGLENAETETGATTSCVAAFLNGASTWAQWESPWITESRYGYTTWVGAEP